MVQEVQLFSNGFVTQIFNIFFISENVKLKGPARAAPERKFNSENREERNNQRNRPDKPTGPGGDFHRFV